MSSDFQEQGVPERLPEWGPRGTAAATFAARLSFENVTHRYGKILAVSGVNLELAPGEIVCILGPSGCGKTTLLRIAAGVERQTEGVVLLNGEAVSGPDGHVPPEKRGVGLMFQDFALFPHLTILENVLFGLKRLDRTLALQEARLALRRVGLTEYERAYPHVLSGGEQQRVALARAIAPRPAVLLMDEPFSGLDQRLRDSVRDETLAVLKETRASSMLVTHDPEEAMRMADRIVLMRNGRVVQVGTPYELYQSPVDAEAARFFSDFNELRGVVSRGCVETPFGPVDAPGIEDGVEVDVLVRPMGIRRVREDTIKGMILSSRFLGDHSLVKLAIGDGEQTFHARWSDMTLPESGSMVPIAADPAHVFVFPVVSG